MKKYSLSLVIAILVVTLVSGTTQIAQANSKGPQIILKYPQVTQTISVPMIRTSTKAHFEVRFESGKSAVDMQSLAVWARKGIFKKSLMDWIKPYIRGQAIVVDGVTLPRGEFILEIQIADQSGETASQRFQLAVQ